MNELEKAQLAVEQANQAVLAASETIQKLVAENSALKERLAEKVNLPSLYWTFDDDQNPVLDADKVIFAIEQAGFAVADNSSDKFIAELAMKTPATDAAIAEIKAQGVDEYACFLQEIVGSALQAGHELTAEDTKRKIFMVRNFAANLRAGRKG